MNWQWLQTWYECFVKGFLILNNFKPLIYFQYNITSLFDACIASLLDDITVENAAKNFYYAQLFNSTNVKGIAKYIDFRKDEVKVTDGWKELNEERGDWLEKQLSKVLNVKKRQIRKRK